ncbi:hypothetical protein GGR58DRAFT_454146 [Xylaria digitata]|nr:hypothetical protein GGR58DRAFT_454146 [Xylaria digitata]
MQVYPPRAQGGLGTISFDEPTPHLNFQSHKIDYARGSGSYKAKASDFLKPNKRQFDSKTTSSGSPEITWLFHLVEALWRDATLDSLDDEAFGRVMSALPELLEHFVRRLGHGTLSKSRRDVAVLIREFRQ